jgi:hypothetical protein
MEDISVNITPVKTNPYETHFVVKSWQKKKPHLFQETMTFKNNQRISDIIYQINFKKPELKGKFILKCGDSRLGSRYLPINKRISDIDEWTTSHESPIIKIITPDKWKSRPNPDDPSKPYPAENPIYSVDFLLFLIEKDNIVPKNLHGCCIFNEKRLGRGENHPANLFLMKTPYGYFLCNIKSARDKFLGTPDDIINPNNRTRVFINIDDKVFQIPKQSENCASLNRIVMSFGDTPPESRTIQLRLIDMSKQESSGKMFKRWFGLLPVPKEPSTLM